MRIGVDSHVLSGKVADTANSAANSWYYIYLTLFPLIYLAIVLGTPVTPVLVALILVWSYYLIIWKGQVEPILYLILFSRCMNGFLIPHNGAAFTIMNMLTGYVPILSLLVRWSPFVTIRYMKSGWLSRYKFTLLYCVALVGFAFVDIELAAYSVFTRIIPMLLFALTCLVIRDKVDYSKVLLFFRWAFVGMLIAYLLPGYSETTQQLLQDSVVFRQSVEKNQYYVLLEYFRNIGIFWDSRMVGLFGYLYLYLALRNRGKLTVLDGTLAFAAMATSMSRGGIVVGLFLVLAHAIGPTSIGVAKRALRVGLIAIVLGVAVVVVYRSPLGDYIQTFSAVSEKGALTQRQGFSDYALQAFWDNPLGNGEGFLKSPLKDRSVQVGDVTYDKVSDAFLAILLGEIGIIGFTLFLLSTFELLFALDRYAIALWAGFLLQLVGTDVPDMGMFYFAFLLVASQLAHVRKFNVAHVTAPSKVALVPASDLSIPT